MNTTPKPGQIAIMASGAVLFLFSFFAFFSAGSQSWNAWSGDVGTLFMATWPALFGLIAAGLVAAVVFGNVDLPAEVLTFNMKQIIFILGLVSFIIMFGYLLGGGIATGGFGGPDKGFGFFLMLLGSIGLLVGAVMELLDTSGSPAGQQGGQPPSSF